MFSSTQVFDVRDDDAPEFVARVAHIFCGSVSPLLLRRIYCIRIDNFFDRSWFRFAGKILGAAGVRFHEKIYVPPFHPHRVVEERRYLRAFDDAGRYERHVDNRRLHYFQTSEANICPRRVMNVDDVSMAALWFSSRSAPAGIASAMCHVVNGGDSFSFYAAFQSSNGWRPFRVIGADADHLARLERLGAAA